MKYIVRVKIGLCDNVDYARNAVGDRYDIEALVIRAKIGMAITEACCDQYSAAQYDRLRRTGRLWLLHVTDRLREAGIAEPEVECQVDRTRIRRRGAYYAQH